MRRILISSASQLRGKESKATRAGKDLRLTGRVRVRVEVVIRVGVLCSEELRSISEFIPQMSLTRRLARELKKIRDEGRKDYLVAISPMDITVWNVSVFGASGTAWEGAILRLEFKFTAEYPIHPPDVRFVGVIPFHPNVYGNGKICLDLLQHNWSSAFGVDSIITSIQTLLVMPNPDSPANNTAAALFSHNVTEYLRNIRLCVEATWH
jgi:ubiquitin-conjugating enzyme E2 A